MDQSEYVSVECVSICMGVHLVSLEGLKTRACSPNFVKSTHI